MDGLISQSQVEDQLGINKLALDTLRNLGVLIPVDTGDGEPMYRQSDVSPFLFYRCVYVDVTLERVRAITAAQTETPETYNPMRGVNNG